MHACFLVNIHPQTPLFRTLNCQGNEIGHVHPKFARRTTFPVLSTHEQFWDLRCPCCRSHWICFQNYHSKPNLGLDLLRKLLQNVDPHTRNPSHLHFTNLFFVRIQIHHNYNNKTKKKTQKNLISDVDGCKFPQHHRPMCTPTCCHHWTGVLFGLVCGPIERSWPLYISVNDALPRRDSVSQKQNFEWSCHNFLNGQTLGRDETTHLMQPTTVYNVSLNINGKTWMVGVLHVS